MPNWKRDSILEARMDGLGGITYQWRDRINLSEIDIDGSLANNARLGEQLDDEHALRLGCSMEAGQPMPGVVLRAKKGHKKLTALAGNHRIKATQLLHLKTIGGYIVECSDAKADLFVRSDNRKHGKGQTDSEAYQHAYSLLHGYRDDYTAADLAREFGVPVNRMQYVLLAMQRREELDELNINSDHVSLSSLLALNKLHQNFDVFVKAVQLAQTYKLTQERVANLAKDAHGCKSEATQLAMLSQWENVLEQEQEQKAKRPKGKKPTSAKTKLDRIVCSPTGLLMLLRTGNNGKPIKSINDFNLTENDAKALVKAWDEIEKNMRPLIKECERWIKQHQHASASANGQAKSKRKGRKSNAS